MQEEVVDFIALRKVYELTLEIRSEANTIMHGNNNETKAVANRIWGHADTCVALIGNSVTPFAHGKATVDEGSL